MLNLFLALRATFSPFLPALFPAGCTHDAFTPGVSQPPYRTELLGTGQQGKQKESAPCFPPAQPLPQGPSSPSRRGQQNPTPPPRTSSKTARGWVCALVPLPGGSSLWAQARKHQKGTLPIEGIYKVPQNPPQQLAILTCGALPSSLIPLAANSSSCASNKSPLT